MSTPLDTFTIIQRLAAEMFDIPLEPLLKAPTLREAGIDSLAVVDLIFALERRFAISIAPEDLEGVRSMSDLAAVIDRIIARQASAKPQVEVSA